MMKFNGFVKKEDFYLPRDFQPFSSVPLDIEKKVLECNENIVNEIKKYFLLARTKKDFEFSYSILGVYEGLRTYIACREFKVILELNFSTKRFIKCFYKSIYRS
ncbi:hypothetical protein BCM26_03835 [Bacillus subtilis]|nr:hypothetical protein BCM26_03835 [Bacillus subtilis]OJH64033.1 hypothetical protein BOH71_06765 [Bacillus subtilis]GLI90659.1 hypothetical protein ANABIO4_40110 [Bacillus subtilis]